MVGQTHCPLYLVATWQRPHTSSPRWLAVSRLTVLSSAQVNSSTKCPCLLLVVALNCFIIEKRRRERERGHCRASLGKPAVGSKFTCYCGETVWPKWGHLHSSRRNRRTRLPLPPPPRALTCGGIDVQTVQRQCHSRAVIQLNVAKSKPNPPSDRARPVRSVRSAATFSAGYKLQLPNLIKRRHVRTEH